MKSTLPRAAEVLTEIQEHYTAHAPIDAPPVYWTLDPTRVTNRMGPRAIVGLLQPPRVQRLNAYAETLTWTLSLASGAEYLDAWRAVDTVGVLLNDLLDPSGWEYVTLALHSGKSVEALQLQFITETND